MSERRKTATGHTGATAQSMADNAVLQFADNALAQALFGSHHGHLTRTVRTGYSIRSFTTGPHYL